MEYATIRPAGTILCAASSLDSARSSSSCVLARPTLRRTPLLSCRSVSRIKQRVDQRGYCQAGRCSPTVATANLQQDELRQKAVRAALDLTRRGWASVEGILSRDECQAYEDGFWEWLSGLGTGVDRHDPITWQQPAWPPSFRGIINSLEVAHQAFVWRVRKNPRVLKVFEELWGTNALLSSFDSINALPAGAEAPQQAWLHVDQAPWRRGVCCVQGLLNLVDVSPHSTGTLLVKDGSHKAHDHFFTSVSQIPLEEQKSCGDHYKFSAKELPHWDSYESIGVEGGAGSLFLWDSRLVHANTFPRKLQAFRHVVYTCYQPASMATQADLCKKQKAYEQYLLTTHWPAMNIRLYERNQAIEYYGVEGAARLPEYNLRRTRGQVEDSCLCRLAGVEPYPEDEITTRKPLLGMTENELHLLLA